MLAPEGRWLLEGFGGGQRDGSTEDSMGSFGVQGQVLGVGADWTRPDGKMGLGGERTFASPPEGPDQKRACCLLLGLSHSVQ